MVGIGILITLPSSLNIFTTSIPGIGCAWSFFMVAWIFRSSATVDVVLLFAFLRGVPLPPSREAAAALCILASLTASMAIDITK